MRLIDADALKETLAEMKIIIDEDVFECNSIHEELVYLLEKVDTVLAEKIDDLPTIEAVPVVHGYWTLRGYFKGLKLLECSVCGKRSLGNGNYCPNCGAKMRTK